MAPFRYYGGVDFSGAREPLSNLWSAVAEEREGRLHVLALCPHPFREDLCGYIAGGWRRQLCAGDSERVLWGADFPFGLPAEAAREIAGERPPSWRGVAGWVADRPADEVRDAFPALHKRCRAADTGGAMAPLDLRLFRQTVEGIRCLHALRDTMDLSILPVAPQEDARDVLIEVYPSGTAKALGIRGGRVPRRPGEVRARAAAVRPWLTFAHPAMEQTAMTLEDARDACIAAVCAWLCRDELDQPLRAGTAPPEAVALEGWIYCPAA